MLLRPDLKDYEELLGGRPALRRAYHVWADPAALVGFTPCPSFP